MLKSKISTETLNACESRITERYASFKNDQETLLLIFSDMQSKTIDSQANALEIFFQVLLALNLNKNLQSIKARDRLHLKELGENCLRYCQIQAVKSQHSHLYSRLYQTLAENSLHSGETWESIIQAMTGEYLGRDGKGDNESSAFLRGLQAWQLGHLRTAKIAMHTIDLQAGDSHPFREQSFRLLIRIYRLSGEPDQALSQWHVYQDEWGENSALNKTAQLERLLCEMQKGVDPKGLHDFLEKEQDDLPFMDLALGLLWLSASRFREIRKNLLEIKRKTARRRSELSNQEQVALQLFSSLLVLHDPDISFQQKLENLGKRLVDLRLAPDPELAHLFLAAAIRWLNRAKQVTLASILMDEYKARSLQYSEGKSTDTLSLIQDMSESMPVVVDRNIIRHHGELYKGMTPRFLKIAQVVAKGSFLMAKLRLKKLSPAEFRQQHTNIYLEILKDFEQTVKELKGPVMKLGQMIAASYFVSDDSRNIMRRVYDSAPAVALDTIKSQVETALQRPMEDVFQEFTLSPLAVASIGQVFQARLHDQTQVAVKLMYPGIDRIVKTDLLLAKLLAPLFRQFISRESVSVIIELFSNRYMQECDYIEEAKNQQMMYQIFEDDPALKIPKLYPEYSSKHMLVMEYIEGQRLDEFIQSTEPAEREFVATQLARFFLLSILKHGVMHIDPHPANFIVMGDRLTVLDFGATVRLSGQLLGSYQRQMLYKYRGDYQGLYAEIIAIRLFDSSELSLELFQQKIGPLMMEPYCCDEVRPFYLEGREHLMEYLLQSGLSKKLRLNPLHYFSDTVSTYMEEMMAGLKVELNWHQLLGSILLEAKLLPELESPLKKPASGETGFKSYRNS